MTNLPASLTRTFTASDLAELSRELDAERAASDAELAELEREALRWERAELRERAAC